MKEFKFDKVMVDFQKLYRFQNSKKKGKFFRKMKRNLKKRPKNQKQKKQRVMKSQKNLKSI